MITNIKFVSIPVRDQNRALDFYTEKLGFTIITDQPFDEKQRWIELRIPKAETRVVLYTMEGQEDRIGTFSPIVFACADVAKLMRNSKHVASTSTVRRKNNRGAPSRNSGTARTTSLFWELPVIIHRSHCNSYS